MFYVPSFTDFFGSAGREEKREENKENIERHEKRKKKEKKTRNKHKKKKKTKRVLPETAQKLISDVRAWEFGIDFLTFLGFLHNFEISHAIGGSCQTFHFLDLIHR